MTVHRHDVGWRAVLISGASYTVAVAMRDDWQRSGESSRRLAWGSGSGGACCGDS